MADKRSDPNSLSDPSKVTTKHLSIEWNVDFKRKILTGSVKLSLDVLQDGVSSVVLDTSENLTVSEVINDSSGEKLTFELKEPIGALGSPLSINLPSSAQAKGSQVCIKVIYETSSSASALGWLEPSQTSGKQHPYLYSQCQAIHARSILPCQDSPSVKATYDAKVTVPRDLVCLMSACGEGDEPCPSDSASKIFSFKQMVPMPSYLIAIVVGALESRKIGPRSKVWSEKELIEKSAYEFAETEEMLSTAEDLMGPYVWGQYDLLILPQSFPYGGMENPCLTFVTPTLLAGDRSLANVVAHEIAHSWTGNLVTNCSWEHFWLNEGFTVFVERKILGRMQGEKARHFAFIGGTKELLNAVMKYGFEHKFTQLIPPLEGGIDPDDAFSSIPYEKGSCFLFYLESLVGVQEFEAFLKSYIEKFKYKTLPTQDWKDYLLEYFQEQAAAGVFDCVEWDKWFFAPGMPPVTPKYDTTLSDMCTELCKRWAEASEGDFGQFSSDDLKSMSSSQVQEFLAQLLHEKPLTAKHIHAMQAVYNLDQNLNSEIRFRWLRLKLRAGDESAIEGALQMAAETGRMKFTRVLYRDLYAIPDARQRAIDTFLENRGTMHPITAKTVARDLHLEG
ncbi:leukotriene A-4 hydrolase-like [Diadema antillarum]|uniref:leukotriene A-4 hydrolase-like n=1 Tax=Diadema antillarum TaxID=105358 RepID=UPI003A8654B9